MKKVITVDQLDVNPEVIANLSDEQLQEIEGGAGAVDALTCFATSCKSQVAEELSE